MADERKIVIELKVAGGAGKNDDQDNEEENLTNVLRKIQHPIKSLEKDIFGKNVFAYMMWQSTKTMVKKAVTYEAEKYFNLSEDYKTEMLYRNTMSVIEHVSGIGVSILGGAIAGAKLGPVGAIGGALLGGATAAVTSIIDARKAWDRQNRELTEMNMQSSFQVVRLGLINDGRGTLN